MNKFGKLFFPNRGSSPSSRPAVIGMIHVKSLPGTPLSRYSLPEILGFARKEAEIYKEWGLQGVMVENMNDVPYVRAGQSGPELVAFMTRICAEVKRVLPNIPCGVQILAALNKESMATGLSADLQFIRSEGFVFCHVADEGLINACAGPLVRYRKQIGAENVSIYTDIKKKHSSHAITGDIDIKQTAEAARFFLSDGVIITGSSTGEPANPEEVRNVKTVADLPVLVGSGVTADNLKQFKEAGADAVIVGSYFKREGLWKNELDEGRIEKFMRIASEL